MVPLGKALVTVGLVIALLGLFIWVGGSIPIVSRLGRLPGDIRIRGANFSFYFPIMTCIVLSIAISLVIALLRR
jgi:formate hydrogenlyase subunit 3/multisubunit Na+/H+ antiporter MnhD subunit